MSIPASVALDPLRPILPALGVTRVGDVTGLDTVGIPVAVAVRPNSRSLAVSQGRGLTRDAAFVSAAMEALEAHHAERIAGPLPLLSEDQAARRGRLIDLDGLPRPVWRSYDPWQPRRWITGTDLLDSGARLVPLEVVSTDYTVAARPPLPAFTADTNGLAAAFDPAGALLHALCEVIERDAAVLWHLRRRAERDDTRVDLDAVTDGDCRWLLARYATAGVTVAAWEITSDLGVPAYLCEIVDREPNPFRPTPPAAGLGCHPLPAVAFASALTEAAQSRLVRVAGTRDDVLRHEHRRALAPAASAEVRARLAGRGRRGLGPSLAGADANAWVAMILDRLAAAGVRQAVVVDLTRADLAVAVVRVVVPGLEGAEALRGGSRPGSRARRLLAS